MTYDKESFMKGLLTGLRLGRPLAKAQPILPTYLTFSSPSEFTLATYNATKNWDGTLEYSTNANTWVVWSGTTTLSSSGGKLYLRGSNNTVITGNSIDAKWVLTGLDISCNGNIETLLDYNTVKSGEHPQMGSYCYFHMFRECTSLMTAPELPATTLARECYSGMFHSCSSLTTAPALPATTLEIYCYDGMFAYCTSLTTAPELPATTLTLECYEHMFIGCTSLTTAPALPATTLATECYYGMFSGCTSLTTAPALPATTLVARCYYTMFYGCKSLKFSTTESAKYQYQYRIPTSGTGTGTSASQALSNMFSSTGGTFKGTPSINTTYYTDHQPVAAS